MTNTLTTSRQFEKLDKHRQVHYSDVLFDSNVIRADDPVAEQRLLALANLLVAKPQYGHIWFTLTSLYELIAPTKATKRIELLKRFQNLYSRFGDRVRFMGAEFLESINAEWSRQSLLRSTPVNSIDKDVSASIAAGDLVGVLKTAHDEWVNERARLQALHDERVKKYSGIYAADPLVRDNFKQNVALYGTANALEQCDDIAKELIVDVAKQPPEALQEAKANHAKYPCTWTLALLSRLADYSATLTESERKANFAQYGGLLEAHQNDYVDAYITASGAQCGMLITNDYSLIDKINFLYDAQPPLVRIQAFTVCDALIARSPPNEDVHDWWKPIP